MSPQRQMAVRYLKSPREGLWSWQDEGEALVWCDGTTVAFRQEIETILEALQPNGFPSFGALVLLLAACRGRIPSAEMLLGQTGKRQRALEILEVMEQEMREDLPEPLEALQRVSELPETLRRGLKPRIQLARAVFEEGRWEDPDRANAILEGMREGLTHADLTRGITSDQRGRTLDALFRIGRFLKQHNAESLAHLMRTGIAEPPEPEGPEPPPSERARALIAALSEKPETGTVARAARDLMAAVRLPRRLAAPEELALGGVADISNRGPLDRLLLSELAHDDLTLTIRVALREALYVRREPPAREPPGGLWILLDSGLRQWGTPRVLTISVALAMIANARDQQEVRVWRNAGIGLMEIDLLSAEGVSRQLEALDPALHAGPVLPLFAGLKSASQMTGIQRIAIVHRETWEEDAGFAASLGEVEEDLDYVGTIDHHGAFALHALPKSRRPPVCRVQLDLDRVFSGANPTQSPGQQWPAIFARDPFPLLLPYTGKPTAWMQTRDERCFFVTGEKGLWLAPEKRKGQRLLVPHLPAGRTRWIGEVGDRVCVVKQGHHTRELIICSWDDSERRLMVTEVEWTRDVAAFVVSGGILLILGQLSALAFDPVEGTELERIEVHDFWLHDRLFRGEGMLRFIAWDGQSIRFHPLPVPDGASPHEITTVFDREGMEGPFFLLGHRALLWEGGKASLPPSNLGDVRVVPSRDGHRLAFCDADGRTRLLIDLRRNRVFQGPLEPVFRCESRNLWRKIQRVSVCEQTLALRSRNGRWLRIEYATNQGMQLQPFNTPVVGPVLDFEPFQEKQPPGCQLRVAQWECGSCAFLDNRGMLHLRSHDPEAPEISLVLVNGGELAGWMSHGRMSGPDYFFEEPVRRQSGSVYDGLQRFVAGL